MVTAGNAPAKRGKPKVQPWSRPKPHWLTRDAWDDAYSNVVIGLTIEIERIMTAENVTQKDLAERTGLSTKHVNQLLSTKSQSLRGLVYLIGALGHDLTFTLERKPEECFESIETSRSSR